MQAVIRSALLVGQLIIAAFYALSAMLMWGPFMAGPLASKVFVAAIVFWPVLGLVLASRGNRFLGLGVTSALALLTVAHLAIVLTFVMNA